MNKVSYLKVSEYFKSITAEVEDLLRLFSSDEYESVESWKKELNSLVPDLNVPLRVALAGEYDVGKSSIIKALTGQNIAISSSVETDMISIYKYNGIELIDMPGTLSGQMDHENKAFQAMANSDLLLYVLTNEMFNKSSSEPFHNMINTLNKQEQCKIIVNQMDRVNIMERDIDEAISIMQEDLEIRVKPFALNQFAPIFISARNYIDSLEEDDEEYKTELMISSRIETLISGIDEFCKEKSIIGRQLRPLQSLVALMDKIRNSITDSDSEYDILNNYWSRQKRIITESESRLRSEITKFRIEKKQQILKCSSPIVSALEDKKDALDIEEEYSKSDENLQEIINKASIDIYDIIKVVFADLEDKLSEFEDSVVSGEVKEIIFGEGITVEELGKIEKTKKIPESFKNSLKGGSSDIGKKLSNNADELAKQFVEWYKKTKDIKFKPYGKIKMTEKASKFIGKAGKALGWLAVGFDFYCNYKEEVDREEWLKRLRIYKAGTKKEFQKVAKLFDDSLIESVDEFIKAEMHSMIDEIDRRRDTLNKLENNKRDINTRIMVIEKSIAQTFEEINRF